MSGLLLHTKLFKPAPRPSLIARQHLIDRLNEGLGHGAEGFAARLTLISAPAGFGKTTLAATWLGEIAASKAALPGVASAWLSLDESDNDLLRFLTYLIAALQTAMAGVGRGAAQVLQSPQPPPAETVLTFLLNDLGALSAPVVLALDDYHVISNTAVHEALSFLLDHLPPRLHLLLTSRRDPPLPLSRLRARSQLTELRAVDLRFSTVEAHDFFRKVLDSSISAADIGALEERTEGWIAGLQMAALSLQGHQDLPAFISGFTGTHRFILDYLTDEVLERRPKGTQNFLLQTSILDRFCGPLCDAVTGQGGGQAILEQLEQANLFLIALDEDRRWYRYHHLFAEVLRSRLRQASSSPAEANAAAAELHRRASRWFEQEGLIDEAIQHALAAQDVQAAAVLVEQYSVFMFQRSEVLASRAWLERLPLDLVHSRPRLILAQGWVMVLSGHGQNIEEWLSAPAIHAVLAAPDLSDDIRGELALLRATQARYERSDALSLELAQEAQRLLAGDRRGLLAGASFTIAAAHLHQGDVAVASRIFADTVVLGETRGGPYMALAALQELSELQMRQGRLHEVLRTCQKMTDMSARWGWQSMPAAGMAQIYVGEVYYQRNDLSAAARQLSAGLHRLGGSTEQFVLARGYVTLAQIQMAQGNLDGALAALQQGETWLTQMHVGDRGAGTLLGLGKVRLWLAQGRLQDAARWFETCRWKGEETNIGFLQRLALVRLCLAQSWTRPGTPIPPDVSDTLSRLLQLKESGGWFGNVVEILVLWALACQAKGEHDTALSTLRRALQMAEPEDYVRLFVDEGEAMAHLLRRLRQQGPPSPYVENLLQAFNADDEPARAALLPEALSERELQVLRLAASGASNKDIAASLFIALPTVKKHMGHILTKLDAHNRVEAIARARTLQLLS